MSFSILERILDNVHINEYTYDNGGNIINMTTWSFESGSGITKFSNSYDSYTGTWYGDINYANTLKITLYVYGPNGEMRKYNSSNKQDILLYSDLPLSPKKPWLDYEYWDRDSYEKEKNFNNNNNNNNNNNFRRHINYDL